MDSSLREKNKLSIIMSTQFIENDFHASAEVIILLCQLLSNSVIDDIG